MIARLSRRMTEIVALPRPAVRPRFTWILPVLFAVASSLASLWPGHGGQLFCIGALPGVWACLLFDSSGDPSAWILPTLLGGVPILFFLGRLLDRLQVDLRVWIAAWIGATALAGFFLTQGFVDLERAIEHHGSVLAYVCCAVQLGSYAATLVSLATSRGRVVGRA